MTLDVTGHYSRPDVFAFEVNQRAADVGASNPDPRHWTDMTELRPPILHRRSSARRAAAATITTPCSARTRAVERHSANSDTCARKSPPTRVGTRARGTRRGVRGSHPFYIVLHIIWFGLWIAVNTGFVMVGRRFDDYPFSLLGILIAIEAIFVTGFLLITQNRQTEYADKRAELDYEVNVRTYRELGEIKRMLHDIERRLDERPAN